MSKCVRQFFKNFALRSDLFAAPATMRYNGQSSYESLCGGILSIVLVIAFGAIFATSFINVLTKVTISSETDVQTDPYNTLIINDLQFAIGIQGLDFSSSQRYFQIVLTHFYSPIAQTPTLTTIDMEPCNKANWETVGDNFGQIFDHHEMEKMLCPIQGQKIQLQGFAGSQVWQFLQVRVEQCHNNSDFTWTCYSPPVIDSYVQSYLQDNDFFEVQIFIVNTLFSPNKDQYLTKTLEDDIFLAFSNNTGSRGTIKIGDYNVTTDESIWPVEDTTEQIGHYITDYRTHTIQLYSTHYAKITIQKDQTVYGIQRTHGKFDQMLSYVGGLFSLLFAFIVFFIGSYSQYKYQIGVAESIFNLDDSGKKVRDQKFNFITFLKYSIYDWLNSFGCTVSWKQMEKIHQAKQQAVQQLDIRYLLKKMERFQRINQILLKERNMICAQLTSPPSLQKIKKLRKITQYYDRVITDEQIIQESGSSSVVPMENQDTISEQNMMSFDKSKVQIPSDFDSQDEEVQKKICKQFSYLRQDNGDQISKNIYHNIPNKMKKRLLKLLMKDFRSGKLNDSKLNSELDISMIDKEKKNSGLIMSDFKLE